MDGAPERPCVSYKPTSQNRDVGHPDSLSVAAALVADGELVSRIGREELCHGAQPIGEGLWRQQRIVALAKFGVLEVDRKR